MKNRILIAGIMLVFLACNEEVDKVEKTSISEQDKKEFKGTTSILFTGNSVYGKFFDENVEREVAYYSRKSNVNERDLIGINTLTQAQTRNSSSKSFPVLINGVDLNEIGMPVKTKSENATALKDNLFENFFGKQVTFSVNKSNETRSSSSSQEDMASLYIPHIIDIIYPVASKTELQPLCPHDDLLVEWNKDEQNPNGVVVMVEWDGDILGQDSRDESVRTIDVVEDTGQVILKKEMFEGMPDFAMINITILRGNIDIVELENTAVKLYAVSNSSISVILAKEPIDI